VARADAEYAVAIERCDDRAGNEKDVCVKEAKAAQVHAVADAEARMTTTDAKSTAIQTSSDADADATAVRADAERDAATDKRDADYAVAREKCDAQSGEAKDLCTAAAKGRFGQNRGEGTGGCPGVAAIRSPRGRGDRPALPRHLVMLHSSRAPRARRRSSRR
jgi:hypothetical protein